MEYIPVESFAVIRADTEEKLTMTIESISEKGLMRFKENPKRILPDLADRILEDVMNTTVNNVCNSSALIPLLNHPSDAINKLKGIRPPAHIIIVTPRHGIYEELTEVLEVLQDLV